MKHHQFITRESVVDNMVYRLIFDTNDKKYCPIPAPLLYDNVARGGYSFPLGELRAYLESVGFPEDRTRPPTPPPEEEA